MTTSAHCTVTTDTLRGGRREGVRLLMLDNGRLRVGLLPQRGMGIWKVWLDGQAFGWQSPVSGPVHPAFVPVHAPDGLGWLEGFDELLCRCGMLSNGAPVFGPQAELRFPLHGRVANLPAEHVDVRHEPGSGAVKVSAEVVESRFLHYHLRLHTTLVLHPGASAFTVRDEITNLAARPVHMQMLYHYNLGAPLLEAGTRLIAPVRELAPRDARAAEGVEGWAHMAPPEPGSGEQVYYMDLHADTHGRTGTLLENAAGDLGASLWFDRGQLPFYALWKNLASAGEGYVVGMEPATNFPNPRPFELDHGRAVLLPPGAAHVIELECGFHQGEDAVRAARARIEAIHAGAPLRTHPLPRSDWSPAG